MGNTTREEEKKKLWVLLVLPFFVSFLDPINLGTESFVGKPKVF